MTKGSELVLVLRFGGGWFLTKPGEERGASTRVAQDVVSRLLSRGYLSQTRKLDGVLYYELSTEGEEQYERYLGVK